MKKLTILIACLIVTLSSFNAASQKAPMRYGKIDMADLEMTVYDKDSSAEAVVLCEYGKSFFTYDNHRKRFRLNFEFHKRIKILKKSGYNWANTSIPIYFQDGGEEEIIGLKGTTYNLENGKILKTKLQNSAKFKEKTSHNWRQLKFALPNVKKGSIIEYSYTLISDFSSNLQDWEFQATIPVKWSEYIVTIPEYYKYKKLVKGYNPFFIKEEKAINQTFSYKGTSRVPQVNGQVNKYSGEFDANCKVFRWAMKDIPAFQNEKYLASPKDYYSQIEFELASKNFVKLSGSYKSYTNTWESINDLLMSHDRFGHQLNRVALVNDIVSNLTTNLNNEEEKMITILEYVKSKIKWNEENRVFVENTLRKALTEKSGNSADINLLLVLMLKEAGLNANPVILSTRKNGKLHPAQIQLSKFNYVIASVKINDRIFLLDATEPLCPYYLLPPRCYNGKGRLISEKGTKWIDLATNQGYNDACMVELKLNEENLLEGKIAYVRKKIAAYNFRKNVKNSTSQDKFIEDMKEDYTGLEVVEYSFENLDSIYKPIKDKYQVLIEDKIDIAGNLIYLNPMLYERMNENPFKTEARKYPVDYTYPKNITYIFKFEIPEGYDLIEQPQNMILRLPNKSAQFSYIVSRIGNTVQVMSSRKINKSLFSPEEYPDLKALYNQIVAKHAEQLVFKKITQP